MEVMKEQTKPGVEPGSHRIGKVVTQNGFNLYLNRVLKDRNITQDELAEMIGISIQGVSRWIRGVNLPTDKNLVKIASALNISSDELREKAAATVVQKQHKPKLLACIEYLDKFGDRLTDEDLDLLLIFFQVKTEGKRRKRIH